LLLRGSPLADRCWTRCHRRPLGTAAAVAAVGTLVAAGAVLAGIAL